ncbi:MAG: recombination protein O N-terminal domain-containing protein [Candidatus Gracilibacteria bacterium]|nr:recombination protein O N-terminal domain-containing protein [Candidatus Gracilibacteria bacterium]
MSIFKTSGVIIKIDKVGIKDFVYTIFTCDYGKIKANKKLASKEKTLDLGYIINFEIETKENRNIHKIRNIKIKSEFLNKNRSFSEINSYLVLLSTILKKIPDGVPVMEVYDIVEKITILPPPSGEKIATSIEIKQILATLKVIDIAGELDLKHRNETISRILRFINANKIDSILKLSGIDENTKKELESLL